MVREEAGQCPVTGKGSQKGKMANFEESERNHLQVRKEIEQEEQEGIQKLLLQEKNWIFHVERPGRKKENMVDGLPSQAWHSEHVMCL